ncbi:hypothetical protein JX265_002288 [Neoarthrinium moseri]|uniref:Uncharacterized protein n=1 Tax=Neoarthrinium moseri TaxID=1658444 RepID=A0A9P9WTY9_9PEZI|nr:uncharacterized protein JN550_007596 [Neoarthrinium moseri]KAI1866743.1 hypothetical protein JN550_007596 [Neoarthrinium moseri]KAI1879334.1 hypothetical protein JX265_002288 [Neoarthrinium moseri]
MLRPWLGYRAPSEGAPLSPAPAAAEAEPCEGFDDCTELLLRKRKKGTKEVSEVEKWREVYTILFPDTPKDEIPFPCESLSLELNDACISNGCEDYEQCDAHRPQPISNDLAQYEQFLLRETPPRLRRFLEHELENNLNIIEESLKRKVMECFKHLQVELLREFRLTQPIATSESANSSEQAPIQADRETGMEASPNDSWLTNLDFDNLAWAANEELDFGILDPFAMLGDADFAVNGGGLIEDIMANSESNAEKIAHDSGYGSTGS